MIRRFASKRDTWLLIVIWPTVGMLLPLAFVSIRTSHWGGGILLIACAVLLLWVVYGTSYRIYDNVVDIRGGPFRWKVPIDSIIAIEPTNDPTSSPACSLDRLALRSAGGKYILVSPVDKDDFIAAIERARTEKSQ